MADPENGSNASTVETTSPSTRRGTKNASLIFISHDTRDADLAEAFSKLLSSVSAGVLKSFRSSDKRGGQGIEYGVEWYPELMAKLDTASDVVCLLTPRSLGRPWLLYEAGVAKGKLDTPVYGVVLGIALGQANTGPFAQFQNCDDDEESLTKLVMQLLRRVPDSEPDQEAVRTQVQAFKKKIEAALKAGGDPKLDTKKDQTPDSSSIAKLFEEVKVMFQDLPSRVEGRLSDGSSRKRFPFRRFHPAMIEEFSFMAGEPGDPIGLLMVASFFRDDLPWLYDLLLETYREIRAGDPEKARQSIVRFRHIVRRAWHTPLMEELGFEPRSDIRHLLHELPDVFERYLDRAGQLRLPDDPPCDTKDPKPKKGARSG